MGGRRGLGVKGNDPYPRNFTLRRTVKKGAAERSTRGGGGDYFCENRSGGEKNVQEEN